MIQAASAIELWGGQGKCTFTIAAAVARWDTILQVKLVNQIIFSACQFFRGPLEWIPHDLKIWSDERPGYFPPGPLHWMSVGRYSFSLLLTLSNCVCGRPNKGLLGTYPVSGSMTMSFSFPHEIMYMFAGRVCSSPPGLYCAGPEISVLGQQICTPFKLI